MSAGRQQRRIDRWAEADRRCAEIVSETLARIRAMRGDKVQGRRRPSVVLGSLPDDIEPGDYWRYLSRAEGPKKYLTTDEYTQGGDVSGNLTGGVWGYASPDGGGIGTLVLHTVREHPDGTISIRPGDGSSNSVKHTGHHAGVESVWHGYVDHGVWESVD